MAKAKNTTKKAPGRKAVKAPDRTRTARTPARWNAHLSFDGRCEEAFRFYEGCLGARLGFMLTYGDSPLAADTPPDFRPKILHGTVTMNGDVLLTGADVTPGQYRKPQGFAVMFHAGSVPAAESAFQKLSEGGAVTMPLQETFWTARFGMLVDAYGVPWIIQSS